MSPNFYSVLELIDMSAFAQQKLYVEHIIMFHVKPCSFKPHGMICRICRDPESYENEIHTFNCPILTEGLELDPNVRFEHIFGELSFQITAIKNYMKIMRKRELLLEL